LPSQPEPHPRPSAGFPSYVLMMSSRVPSKSHRSGLNMALNTIGKKGGGHDGGRTTTGGVHVEVDESTDGLYHDPSSTIPGFRYNPCLRNVHEDFNLLLILWLSFGNLITVVVNIALFRFSTEYRVQLQN
jgi:hypothetical protein